MIGPVFLVFQATTPFALVRLRARCDICKGTNANQVIARTLGAGLYFVL